MANLVELIKQAADEANQAGQPCTVVYGTVKSVSPISIMVDQKLTLTSDFIVLGRNVTDYEVEMTVDHTTDNSSGGTGESAFASHKHAYKGKKKFKVHNGLKAGDKVIMIRQAGGQSYIVLDKIGGAT